VSNPAPITLAQLFRYFKHLPHQMAAISELEADIRTAGYAVAMRRDRPWFKTWSVDGKQPEPVAVTQQNAVSLALPLIKEFEGCKLVAYPDPGTGGEPWTIGWGSTTYTSGQRVKPGDTITQAQADELLTIRVRRDALQLAKTIPTWAAMKPHQQAALLSFTYNVGPNWYGEQGFQTITARVMDAQFDRVPEALLLYVNPGTSVTAGLTRRRKAEGAMWEGKTLGGLGLPAQQGVKVPAHLRLTRTGKVDGRGLELLSLRQVVDGIPMGELLVVSGAPGAQQFKKGRESRAGSLEPLPEGRYGIEDIDWKAGKDNYQGNWGPGLGPVWVGINYQAPGKTERSAIGIHLDENQGTNPGTAGCVGIRSVADLKRLVAMLRAHNPRCLYVDWNLGTCPPVRPV
jgi:GH24 family phage-related lysozyme (muramidase)